MVLRPGLSTACKGWMRWTKRDVAVVFLLQRPVEFQRRCISLQEIQRLQNTYSKTSLLERTWKAHLKPYFPVCQQSWYILEVMHQLMFAVFPPSREPCASGDVAEGWAGSGPGWRCQDRVQRAIPAHLPGAAPGHGPLHVCGIQHCWGQEQNLQPQRAWWELGCLCQRDRDLERESPLGILGGFMHSSAQVACLWLECYILVIDKWWWFNRNTSAVL